MLAETAVDLVLLDVLMPGMDGYEVCRRLRADPATAFLPVVMITASGDQPKAVRAIEAGADDFIAKPFDQAELLARVASLVRLKRYHDTIVRQAAELEAWNAELGQRVEAGGRRARADQPAAALPLARSSPISSSLGDEDPAGQPPAGDRGRVLRPPRLHPLRGDQRARGGDGGPRATTTRRWADLIHRHEGTLERFTGDGIDGLLQRPRALRRRPSSVR